MMKRLKALWLVAGAAVAVASGALAESAKNDAAREAVMERLGRMVGGHWVSAQKMADGSPLADLRFEWGPDHTSLRGAGKIAGMTVESRHAWDPAAKAVYYLDSHGPETVYFGHVRLEGEEIVTDFRGIVGDLTSYRSRAHFSDPETYRGSIAALKDGKEVPMHEVILRRER